MTFDDFVCVVFRLRFLQGKKMTYHGVSVPVNSMLIYQSLKERIHPFTKPIQLVHISIQIKPLQEGKKIPSSGRPAIMNKLFHHLSKFPCLVYFVYSLTIISLPCNHSHHYITRQVKKQGP